VLVDRARLDKGPRVEREAGVEVVGGDLLAELFEGLDIPLVDVGDAPGWPRVDDEKAQRRLLTCLS
jgi:hypothetical protein